MFPITATYAATLTGLSVFLSINVIRQRRRSGVSLGCATDQVLERRVRAQGNFAEYTPIGLLMMVLLEGSGMNDPILHVIGVILTLGRFSHAYALSRAIPQPKARITGMALTFAALIMAILSGVFGTSFFTYWA